MSLFPLTGLWASAPTTFAPDLTLDETGLARNLDHWAGALGLAGLIVGGTEGEGTSLPHATRERLFSCASEAVAGRAGLILNCTDANDERMIALIGIARGLGATAAMIDLPRLPGTGTQDETVLNYVRRIASGAGIGLVIDANPGAGYSLSPRTAARLAEIPGVVALRYVAPSGLRAELSRHLGAAFPVSGGDEACWLDEIVTHGTHLHLGGAAPLLMQTAASHRITDYTKAARAGRTDDARAISATLDPLREALVQSCPAEKPLAHAKHWLALQGLAGGPVRPPWLPLTSREEARIARAFEDVAPA